VERFEPYKCKCPVDSCLPPAGWRQLLTFRKAERQRISTLGPKIRTAIIFLSPYSPWIRQAESTTLFSGRHHPIATLPKRRPGSSTERRFTFKELVSGASDFPAVGHSDGSCAEFH